MQIIDSSVENQGIPFDERNCSPHRNGAPSQWESEKRPTNSSEAEQKHPDTASEQKADELKQDECK